MSTAQKSRPTAFGHCSLGCLEASALSNGDGPPADDALVDRDALDVTRLDVPAVDGGFASGVSRVACSTFGASRGSYADRLASGGGKGHAYGNSKHFPVCQSIAINPEEETINVIDQIASDLSSLAVAWLLFLEKWWKHQSASLTICLCNPCSLFVWDINVLYCCLCPAQIS
ncbi:hypothetical protein SUGI_0728090 [Cryptomeria japonica]|nr:hypothetical protein SUGI_0728090 [Cryptomeria japonica]